MRRTKRPYRRGDDLVTMGIALFVLELIVGIAGPKLFPGNGALVPYVLGMGTAGALCYVTGMVMRK